jgi:hypothetical protein
MQVHFLFVLRKLLTWLFAFLSALLPHHLLVQVPENERCLAPQEASLGEASPPVQASAETLAAETDATVPLPE